MRIALAGFFVLPATLFSGFVGSAKAAQVVCLNSSIVNILGGPKHGAMIKISNADSNCDGKWICLGSVDKRFA